MMQLKQVQLSTYITHQIWVDFHIIRINWPFKLTVLTSSRDNITLLYWNCVCVNLMNVMPSAKKILYLLCVYITVFTPLGCFHISFFTKLNHGPFNLNLLTKMSWWWWFYASVVQCPHSCTFCIAAHSTSLPLWMGTWTEPKNRTKNCSVHPSFWTVRRKVKKETS